MNSLTQFKKISILPFLIALMLVALAQNTQAVSPPPDGGYPDENTAEGDTALLHLTLGKATRPTVFKRSIATPPAAPTLPSVMVRFCLTPAATTTRPTV